MPESHLSSVEYVFKACYNTDNKIPITAATGNYVPYNGSGWLYGPGQAQMNSVYAGTTLEGKVTAVSGWHKFVIPETSLYRFAVRGSQGGSHGNKVATNWCNYGGRGALITASFILHKDDVIYVLCGTCGRCGGTEDWGGGGGGASAVFLVDTTAQSHYVFRPANVPIIPLIVAGGGAGRSDAYTGGYAQSGDITFDNNALNAKPENGTNTNYGGYSSGRYNYNAGQGLTGGYDSTTALLGGGRAMYSSSYYGGFGGGGVPYNGGGGGAGWSGGYFSDGYPSYGGTSWVDPSGLMVTRQVAPAEMGYTLFGQVNMSVQTSPDKNIIAKDSDGLKYYSTDSSTWTLLDDQTEPPTDTTFDTYGVVTADTAAGLNTQNPVKWYIRSSSDEEILFFNGMVDRAVLSCTYDVDLSIFTDITSITVNTPPTGVIVSTAASTDGGKTWYTYNNGNWDTIDITNKADFITKGIPLQNLSSTPLLDLTMKTGSSSMRLCFCILENTQSTDIIIDTVSITGTSLSGWDSAINGTDYTYRHVSPTNVEITFKTTGTYKINYPYSD